MKKNFSVLAAILLLAIVACSGGGISQRVTISPSGGTQALSDGTKVTFDAGIVNSLTTVVVTKYNSSPTSVGEATELSPTYEVEIPLDNITDLAGDESDSNKFITFEIPVQTNSVKAKLKSSVSFSSIADDAYNLSHVVIDYTSDKLHLFGNYVVQASNSVIRVSHSTLVAVKQMATDTKVKIQITIINVKPYFNVGETLYKVIGPNGFADFMDVTNLGLAGQGLGNKIPLIMIHGWQKSLDAEYKNPHITTWQNFINYFYSSTALQEKYMLYSYRYDSDHSIDENAQRLGEIIRGCFGDTQKVVILAHSMGGLVSHYYIQRTYDAGTINGSSRVLKLITLATPYHGSPVVQYLQGETTLTANLGIAAASEVGLALVTPGTQELKWDNFDSNQNIVINNEPLRELNKNMTHQELYFAFGGRMELSYTHGLIYEASYNINFYLDYILNDGIVPLVSAFNAGHPDGFVEIDTPNGENDYDHSQMVEGKGNNVLFDKIEHVLITTISGQITYNGSSLADVTVTLAGASLASTKTDANGNYSFNVVKGNYTLTPSLTGYTFDRASISLAVNNADVTEQNFTAIANAGYTLSIVKPTHGTITSPVGINCGTGGDVCSVSSIPANTVVNLTCNADNGWLISGVTDVCSDYTLRDDIIACINNCTRIILNRPSVASVQVYMTSSKTLDLFSFESAVGPFALTINKTGDGTITSLPVGINCGDSCSANFDGIVTLTATAAEGWHVKKNFCDADKMRQDIVDCINGEIAGGPSSDACIATLNVTQTQCSVNVDRVKNIDVAFF